jgi:hypothetical protein
MSAICGASRRRRSCTALPIGANKTEHFPADPASLADKLTTLLDRAQWACHLASGGFGGNAPRG